MKTRVIDGFLLTVVDKILAISLYQKGFEIVGIDDADGIDWIERSVYNEETGEDEDMKPEDVIKGIMDYDGPVYIASLIPINFVEVGNGDVIKTKYKVGDMVYAFVPESGISYSPAKITKLKVVGMSCYKAYNLSRIDKDNGSRRTTQEVYVRGNKTSLEIQYILADEKYTYVKGYILKEDEIFESIEKAKESVHL